MIPTNDTWTLAEAVAVSPLTDQPRARTNLLELKGTPEKILSKLLTPTSTQYAIDFGLRTANKARKESLESFYQRLHGEIKAYLRQQLGLADNVNVKYELIRLDGSRFVFFFLNQPAAGTTVAATLEAVATRMGSLCQDLSTADVALSRLIQALFGLRLKVALLNQASERFPVPPAYWNSTMYLNTQLTRSLNKKTGYGVVESFEVDVFCSDQQEIAITLHKRKFLITQTKELNVSLDDESGDLSKVVDTKLATGGD